MSLERPVAPDPYELLPAVGSFAVASEDVTGGDQMDKMYAHPGVGGQNISPQLSWSGFPAGTRSFTVTCFDPDAPTPSGFWHWVAVNLPVSGPHRYYFVVHAVDVDALDLNQNSSAAYASFNLVFHTLARAIITPTYQV